MTRTIGKKIFKVAIKCRRDGGYYAETWTFLGHAKTISDASGRAMRAAKRQKFTVYNVISVESVGALEF